MKNVEVRMSFNVEEKVFNSKKFQKILSEIKFEAEQVLQHSADKDFIKQQYKFDIKDPTLIVKIT